MKKRSYKFTIKKHTKKGLISAGIGLLALLSTGLTFYCGYKSSGNSGPWISLVACVSMLGAGYGMGYAIFGLKEEDVYYFFAQLGAGLNGCLLVFWMIVFMLGI